MIAHCLGHENRNAEDVDSDFHPVGVSSWLDGRMIGSLELICMTFLCEQLVTLGAVRLNST